MLTFNPQEPHTVTYGPDAGKMPYFQNGLYFSGDGRLIDCDHNRATLKARGLTFKQATAPDPEPAAVDPNAEPPVKDALTDMSPDDVFKVAERLRAQLDVANDEDNYVPTQEALADNLAFIRRHTK